MTAPPTTLSQIHPTSMVLARPAVLAVLLMRLLTACGGAQTVAAPVLPPLTEAQVRGEAPALERRGQSGALLERIARVPTPLSPELQVTRVRALWMAGNSLEAQRAQDLWVSGRDAGKAPDAAAMVTLARWHLHRHAADQAWAVLSPLRQAGLHRSCGTPVSTLTQQILSEWHPANVVVLALEGAPVDTPPQECRTRWVVTLAEQLLGKGAAVEARTLLAQAVQANPDDLRLWAAWLSPDKKQPSPEMRTSWLAAVDGAGQPPQGGRPLDRVQLQRLARLPQVDRITAARLYRLATTRAGATDTDWYHLAHALLRADDVQAATELARQDAAHFASPIGKVVLARVLIGLHQLPLVRPMLLAMPQDDAWTLLLQAEVLRQDGQLQQADLLRQTALERAPDRSAVALVAAQFLARAGLPSLALQTDAANHPGLGQWAGVRMRAMEALNSPRRLPQKIATAAVAEYARHLTMETPEVTVLSDEPPVDAAEAREALLRLLDTPSTTWTDAWVATLRTFADANLADGAMLRELAIRALRDDDAPGFLALDARAREAAKTAGTVLPLDKVLQELSGRQSTVLARWLRDVDVREQAEPAVAWKVANILLKGPFAWLGRLWAEEALARTEKVEPNPTVPRLMVVAGSADLALEWLEKWQPTDVNQEAARTVVEAEALFAMGRTEEGAARLGSLMQRQDLAARQLRPALESAWDHGQCDTVMRGVPKLMSDKDDLASWRSGVQRGLECARRMGQPAWMELVMESAKMPQPDPNRIDTLARELVNFGYFQRAADVFASLDKIRPLMPDTLSLWARALLNLGQEREAFSALNRAVLLMQGRSTLFHQKAAETLEDFGLFVRAAEFWALGTRQDPDNANLRYRLILNLLRSGQTDAVPDQVLGLLRAGPSPEMLEQVVDVAARAGKLPLLMGAVAGSVDADRETERLRLSLAARLGQRDAVEAGVRRLRAKRSSQSAQAPAWLLAVGSGRLAREVAEDLLSSAEPTGVASDRAQVLRLALRERRDPTSDAEALTLTRYYVGRALDPQRAAMEAAMELARVGLAEPARAVSMLANQGDHPLRTCMQATFEHDAGHHAQALILWQRSMAGALLDPRTRDFLRSGRAQSRDNDGDEVGLEIQCVLSGLTEAHELTLLGRWFHDLLVMAPESSMVRSRLFHIHVLRGDMPAAMAELRDAAQVLPELPENDWRRPCERLLRDGGGQLLLEWLDSQGDALRCEPWLLAFGATVLASQSAPVGVTRAALLQADAPIADTRVPLGPPATATVRANALRSALAGLAPLLPSLRIELALQWSARGNAQEAAAILGDAPLAVGESLLGGAVNAVAATAIALSAREDAGQRLDGWLKRGRGVETRAAVAHDLVLQGHPQLAVLADPPPTQAQPLGQAFTSPQVLRRRALAGLATSDDAVLVSQWASSLRAQRANPENRSTLEQQDLALLRLLRAGRITAAQGLARVFAETEPGVRSVDLLQAPVEAESDAAALLAAATAFSPHAAVGLTRDPATMGVDLQRALLRLAVASDDTRALRWSERREKSADEVWRPWWELVDEATGFERWSLAQEALRRALHNGMPAAMAACRALTLQVGGDAGAPAAGVDRCLRKRSLHGLEESELGDVAAAVAMATDASSTASFWTQLRAASQPTQANFLSAASTRLGRLQPAQIARLRAQLEAWLGTLEPVQRDSLLVVALDDFAALGLGQLGLEMEQRVSRRDPESRSERNNLAYAQFLAGGPLEGALRLAEQAAFQTGGEAAYATLDTLACIQWALGNADGAVAAQAKALASAALAPKNGDAGMSLPLVRQAEFQLGRGQRESARVLAALALQKPEEAGTSLRARRVLAAVLRSAAAQPSTQPATRTP